VAENADGFDVIYTAVSLVLVETVLVG